MSAFRNRTSTGGVNAQIWRNGSRSFSHVVAQGSAVVLPPFWTNGYGQASQCLLLRQSAVVGPQETSNGGTTYAKDASFTAATGFGVSDVAEHSRAATLLAGSRLVGVKAVERPRAVTATAGTAAVAADVFTASEIAAFTSGARLVAADAFTATDTATFTATARLAGADLYEATRTATFVAGTTIAATAQAGFVAKTARLIAGTVANATKAVTTSRAFTATAGTLLRAVSATPVVQKTARLTAGTTVVATDATTLSRTATVTARATVIGDDIFIATETATFRAGTTATGVSQKTAAAISAKTATFAAGTQLAAVKALETAAPIGHIDGTSATSRGVEDATSVRHVETVLAGTGVDGAIGLVGVIE